MGLLPGQFWDTWDSYIEWSLDLGLPGLGILSFTEAVIQPIPPEALTLPMYLEAQGEPMELFLIWLIVTFCLLYTSPSPRDRQKSRMPSSA